MKDTVQEEYTAFEEKVNRTVYLDNLSPQATVPVIRNALDQFGKVMNVQFIPDYLNPSITPKCALVEMETEKEAKNIIRDIAEHPLMIAGMPRPVTARVAVMEMFDDIPKKPGLKIDCRWLQKSDPDFPAAKMVQQLAKKHVAEASFLLKNQRMEEERLAKKQLAILKATYKKLESIESVDGVANRLAREYHGNV